MTPGLSAEHPCLSTRSRRVVVTFVSWLMFAVLVPTTAVVVQTTVGTTPAAAQTTGLSTFAGSGATGHADGTGTAATFDKVVDLARSPDGAYLYALDNGTGGRPNTIRRITVATGGVETFATGGMLVMPTTIEVDSSGQVWVSVTVPDSDPNTKDPKGIIKYPASGGTPQLMVSGIIGDYFGGSSSLGEAFTFDPSGENIYFNAASDKRVANPHVQHSYEPQLLRLALSSLPAPASSADPLDAPGSFVRDAITDMAWDSSGRLYLIWTNTGPSSTSYAPELYRFDAPGSFKKVRGEVNNQPRIVFAAGSSSAYMLCNACDGHSLVIRRSAPERL